MSPRLRPRPTDAALGLFAALLYVPTLGIGFLADDFGLVEKLREGGPWAIWSGGEGGFLRPLSALSLFVDDRLWGGRTTGFHATNLVLHALVTVLVAAVARRFAHLFDPSCAGRVGCAAGLLFAVFAGHAEPVAWISGRTDLIATAFGCAALAVYLGSRGAERRRLALAGALFACGLFAKESVIVLPAIVLALEFARRGPRLDRIALARVGAFAVVAAAYLAVRTMAIGTPVGGYGPGTFDPARMPLKAAAFVLRSVLPGWPVAWLPAATSPLDMKAAAAGLLRDHPAPVAGAVLAGALALALLVAAVARRRRAAGASTPRALAPPAALAGAFLAALLPVVGLGIDLSGSGGERLLYFPSVFSLLLVAWLVARAPRTGGALALAALALLHVIALAGAERSWRAAGRLAERTVASAVRVDHLPERPVSWIGVPDSYRGAYVLRNGFASALRMARPGRPPETRVLAWLALTDEHATLQVEARPAGPHVFRCSDPRARFVVDGQRFELFEAAGGRGVLRGPATLEVVPAPSVRLAWITAGEARVPGPPAPGPAAPRP